MVPSLVLRYRIRQIAHSNSCVATLAAPIFFLAQDLTRGYAWRKRNTFSLSTAKVLTLTALLLLVAYAGYTPTPGHSQGNLGLPAPPLAGLLQHVPFAWETWVILIARSYSRCGAAVQRRQIGNPPVCLEALLREQTDFDFGLIQPTAVDRGVARVELLGPSRNRRKRGSSLVPAPIKDEADHVLYTPAKSKTHLTPQRALPPHAPTPRESYPVASTVKEARHADRKLHLWPDLN